MTRTPARRALAALTALTALTALAACGGDDDVEVRDGGVTLDDAGAEAGRVQLPGPAVVGASGSASAAVAIAVSVDGQEIPVELRLDFDGEVVEADDTGYTLETTFTGGEVIDAPAGAEADLATVTDIVGVTYRQRYDADGSAQDAVLVDPDALTAAQRSAYDEFGSQLDSAAFDFPDEPVGEGATWRSVSEVSSQGLEVAVTYQYELQALSGDEYTIAISYDEDIDTEVQGADVTGSLRGGGTTTATIGNPMSQATSMEQDFDVSFDQDGSTTDLTMRIGIDVTPGRAG
jgi:hypothetical protein